MGAKDAYTDGTYQGQERAAQLYSDIDLFFGPKTGTNDINKVTDFVRQSNDLSEILF